MLKDRCLVRFIRATILSFRFFIRVQYASGPLKNQLCWCENSLANVNAMNWKADKNSYSYLISVAGTSVSGTTLPYHGTLLDAVREQASVFGPVLPLLVWAVLKCLGYPGLRRVLTVKTR